MTAPDAKPDPRKPLMRHLGEFVGHIVHGLRTDPGRTRKTIRREVEETDRGDVVLRRTTVEEIEFKTPPAE